MNAKKRPILFVLPAVCLAAALLLGIPTSRAAGEVCEIVGGAQYMTLDAALSAAADGDTIRLLAVVDHSAGIFLNAKALTFDLNGYDLNVDTTSAYGLQLNHGTLALTGAGSFNVTGATFGVYAESGSTATVTNATAAGNGTGAAASGSSITVTNDVRSGGVGVEAYGEGASVHVGGNINASGIGAFAYLAGAGTASVRVDGIITAGTYVRVQDETKDGSPASRTVPTLLAGYHTYSSGNNIVYVKTLPLAVVTNAVTNLTASGATLNGEVTGDGGLSIDGRGFVWSISANPEIGGPGVAQADAGSGLGAFSAALTGLTTPAVYHVRAYAIAASLSGGPPLTVYGEDVRFTLREDDDDDPAPRPTPTPAPVPDVIDIPKTGDGGGFPVWPGIAGLALLAASGLAALRYKKKKT
ncbi:MAG: hypothetical protein AAGU74_02445 [Bacillota bacterium]